MTDPSRLTNCSEELPALGVTRQFDFGQFIELFDPGSGPNPVPVPVVVDPIGNLKLSEALRQAANASGSAGSVSSVSYAATGADGGPTGGVSLQSLLAPANTTHDHVESAKEVALTATQVATLVAAHTLTLEGSNTRVGLSADAIKRLFSGEPVELFTLDAVGRPLQRLRVVPPAPEAAPGSVTIQDLAGFLAQPLVPAVGGGFARLSLTAEGVSTLRSTGVLDVSTPRGVVRLQLVQTSTASSTSAAVGVVGGTGSSVGTVGSTGVGTVGVGTVGVGTVGTGTVGVATPVSSGGVTVVGGPGGPVPATVAPRNLHDHVGTRLRSGRGIPVAVLVPWRQTWTLSGFSRGALLNSLALTPQEEVTIEMRTWERRQRSLEQSSETDAEQSFEMNDVQRDSDETFRELTSRQDFSWQLGGSLDVSYSNGVASVNVSANASAESVKNLADVSRTTSQRMRESTSKAAARVRTRRTTRIAEAIESGAENRITRKIRNSNLTRTVTYDFFETLAHYSVSLEFQPDRLAIVALVRNPELRSPLDFTETFVRQNESTFRNALLEPSLADGFPALRLLSAYGHAKRLLAARETDAKIRAVANEQKLPSTDSTTTTDPAAAQRTAVMQVLVRLHAAAINLVRDANISAALLRIRSQTENGAGPMNETERRGAQLWLFIQCLAARMPSVLDGLKALGERRAEDLSIDDAQRLVGLLPPEGSPRTLASLGEMTAKEKEDAGLASAIKQYMRIFWDWDHWTNRCREENLYTPNDAGIVALTDQLTKALQAWEAKRAEGVLRQDKDEALATASNQQDSAEVADELTLAFPLDELAKAVERSDALLGHIAAHPQHYSYALFQALTPSEQVTQLLKSSGGQLQVGLFEPRVVAMHGDRLAVPLTPLAVGGLSQFMTTLRTTLTTALGVTDPEPDTIVVPTPGVNIASRLGACTTAEAFVEESRELDLKLARARLRQAEAEAAAAEAEAKRREQRLVAGELAPFTDVGE